MTTVVSSNLQVDNFAPTAGGTWTEGFWKTNDSTFTNSIQQTISSSNVIVPLSSVDAKDFYFTAPPNVKGNGAAGTATYTKLTGTAAGAAADVTALTNAGYAGATGTYLDYHFVLKATNTTNAAMNIVLSQLDLTFTVQTAIQDTDKAFRIGIFADKFSTATVNGAKTAPGLTNVDHIYCPSEAVNFTSGKAVNATNGCAILQPKYEFKGGSISSLYSCSYKENADV